MKQTAVEFLYQELDNILELYPSEWDKIDKVYEQAKEMEKEQKNYKKEELKSDLLENLVEINKIAIKENWKMKDVGIEFFKVFAYSKNNTFLECEHKTQHFSDVFGHYISKTNCECNKNK